MRSLTALLVAPILLSGCSLIGTDDLQGGTAAGAGGSTTATTSTSASVSASASAASGAGGGAVTATTGVGGGEGAGGGPIAACPDDMILASDDALGVAFCIDRTEVTQTAYLAFILDVGDGSTLEQPEPCTGNVELTDPVSPCPDFEVGSDRPVYCVDWCDARAYCEWAGKRLCGKIGGGAHAPFDAPATQEEWNFACTGGLVNAYPYGPEPEVGACNIPEENTPDDESDDNRKTPVASMPGCEGGFEGLFDMEGNVAEWVDWCGLDPGGSGTEVCHVRGGHTYGTAAYWSCGNLDQVVPRMDTLLEIGVRCCADSATN